MTFNVASKHHSSSSSAPNSSPFIILQSIMPFYLFHSSPPSSKYSFIEQQQIHENEYKKFLNTLPSIHQQSSNRNFAKARQISREKSSCLQRQNQLKYRQDKRKHEYERIERENLRFSQRLINAKSFFDRSEQEAFFERHCKLKQRLQHYSHSMTNQVKKSDLSVSSKRHWKMEDKPIDSSFLIYNDHRIAQKSNQRRETDPLFDKNRTSKSQQSPSIKREAHKPLSIISDKTNSQIQSSRAFTKPSSIPSPNTIHWNPAPHAKHSEQSSSGVQAILSSNDLSSSSELSI